MSRSQEYERRIHSPGWAKLRADRIVTARWRCERCEDLAFDLQLHHKHYDSLGCERPEDLELLCSTCHKKADAERSVASASRNYGKRLDGWASKKYGDDWEFRGDIYDIEEEFSDWLDRKEEEEW